MGQPFSAEQSQRIRKAFPILDQPDRHGRTPTYLDSAATELKPQVVIDGVTRVLTSQTANVHRSVHRLGDEATSVFEGSRRRIANFIGCDEGEIIVLRNTSEALNLVSRCWPETQGGNKRIITSAGEHHSNLLPWGDGDASNVTRLAPRPDGKLNLELLAKELAHGNVGLVSVSHVSNVTGLENPVREIADLVHSAGAILVVDAAQSVGHQPLDIWELNCDFLAFSGHKLGGPTGVGILFGRAEHLDRLDWYLRGGATVESVSKASIVAKPPPWKFEAGTPPIEGIAGLAAAIEFLDGLGLKEIQQHRQELAALAASLSVQKLSGVRVLGGEEANRTGPVSLSLAGVNPHIIARGLSEGYSTFVRSGFHCAQPLHEALETGPSLRLSFGPYNTAAEVEQTIDAIRRLAAMNA